MLGRREFLGVLGVSVGLFESNDLLASEGADSGLEDEWFFDGTGLPKASSYEERMPVKKITRPLWLTRGRDEYRVDIATKDGYKALRWALRDVMADKMGYPDLALLSALSRAQTALASLKMHSRFDFTSGLRTPQTNSKIEGAAQASLHLPDADGYFKASDFRAKGFDSEFTAKLMRMVGMGGIGIYHVRDFVHADTGRMRTWRGH